MVSVPFNKWGPCHTNVCIMCVLHCVLVTVCDGGLIYYSFLSAKAVHRARFIPASAGFGLDIFTENFLVMTCDYLLHVWGCSVTDFN